MKIKNENPPNYEQIKSHFDIEGRDIVFTYGDTIYNPSGKPMSPHLLCHEETHIKQQEAIGPEEWWDLYFKTAAFRVAEEAQAYCAQLAFIRNTTDRNTSRYMRKLLAKQLASPIYGNAISEKQAMELIKIKL